MEDSLPNYIAIAKNLGQTTPKNSGDKLLQLQKQKQCADRALKIVEFLIEGKLRPQILFKCLNHVNQSYYQDTVEERAISKLCGYPLCDGKIVEMPTKQFHINSKANTVSDISDRKNFCSQFCYKASNHLKSQVDDSPLWLRSPNQSRSFNLLSSDDLNSTVAPSECEKPKSKRVFTSVTAFADVSLQELMEINLEDSRSSEIKPPPHRSEEKDTEIAPKVNSEVKPVKIKQTQRDKHKNVDVLEIVKRNVNSWFTYETFVYLYGVTKVKEALDASHLETIEMKTTNSLFQMKYETICAKLQLQELKDKQLDRSLNVGTNFNPTPDYKQLVNENKLMEIKVKSFYQGTPFKIDESRNSINNKEKVEQNDDEDKEELFLNPVIEKQSSKLIRQRILLNSLQKCLDQILTKLQIGPHEILNELKCLVQTFDLHADNVVHKPILLNLIAIVLLELLAIKDATIKHRLECGEFPKFQSQLFDRFPGGCPRFTEFISEITNIEMYFKNNLNN